MPHSLADLLIHVVFSTKGRAPLVGSELKPKLYAYMVGIAKQHGCKIHIVNGTKDHVHMLLAVRTTACLADLMRFVKGSSSRWVHQEFPANGSFGWQRGFAAFSVSRSRFRDVYHYIECQEEHHKKVSFKEELVALLKRHQIEYDERYVWS